MSDKEEFESAMSFWFALDNLATVTEDSVGEQIEELVSESESHGSWKVDSAGLVRLNSEGEEIEEGETLDEEYLTCLTGRLTEESLFLTGMDFQEEYFESLSGLVGNKEEKCNFCQVSGLADEWEHF